MRGDVGHPHRPRIIDEQTQNATTGRQIADRVALGDRETVGDELDESTVRSDHAERTVTGTGQRARRSHDPVQRAAQVEIAADADDRLQQRRQPLPAGHDLADPVQQLLQQLIEADPRQRRDVELRWRPGGAVASGL